MVKIVNNTMLLFTGDSNTARKDSYMVIKMQSTAEDRPDHEGANALDNGPEDVVKMPQVGLV